MIYKQSKKKKEEEVKKFRLDDLGQDKRKLVCINVC